MLMRVTELKTGGCAGVKQVSDGAIVPPLAASLWIPVFTRIAVSFGVIWEKVRINMHMFMNLFCY